MSRKCDAEMHGSSLASKGVRMCDVLSKWRERQKDAVFLKKNTSVFNAWLLLIEERFHRKKNSSSKDSCSFLHAQTRCQKG